MDAIVLEPNNIRDYITTTIEQIKSETENIADAKYHHNSSYHDAISICQSGILTMQDLQKLGIKHYSKEVFAKLSDIESHINGVDAVSLAIVGLQDLYDSELEYSPFNPKQVDFLVSSKVKTRRISLHYGNEFLSFGSIAKDQLRAIDIRLLKLINSQAVDLEILNKYNDLILIAKKIQEQKLNIPLREMSQEQIFALDIDSLANQPKLILKP